ncbi:hypothetical protein OTK49_03395 [Vibrio coralliirubri]|uniref:hypothetical protein n=1 Tax=Vibrio coralliirubri TaxID=1516159 RepID=UPI0022850D28|nr:hypothetical protein [Vibrio coralliirubri]MCY9861562.1 hypothetical protein [Vibrio coralliirubri]
MKKQASKNVMYLAALVMLSILILVGEHTVKGELSVELSELQKKHMLVAQEGE